MAGRPPEDTTITLRVRYRMYPVGTHFRSSYTYNVFRSILQNVRSRAAIPSVSTWRVTCVTASTTVVTTATRHTTAVT